MSIHYIERLLKDMPHVFVLAKETRSKFPKFPPNDTPQMVKNVLGVITRPIQIVVQDTLRMVIFLLSPIFYQLKNPSFIDQDKDNPQVLTRVMALLLSFTYGDYQNEFNNQDDKEAFCLLSWISNKRWQCFDEQGTERHSQAQYADDLSLNTNQDGLSLFFMSALIIFFFIGGMSTLGTIVYHLMKRLFSRLNK